MPCFKLGIRFNRPDMVKRFLRSGRTGFYLAVLQEGEIGAGDPLQADCPRFPRAGVGTFAIAFGSPTSKSPRSRAGRLVAGHRVTQPPSITILDR
jgi:MOSC domain-containing protein YiiM